MRPDQILPALLRSDPARPRVTFYEDTPGPTRGERIELSAKVLANWVAKAANVLSEEFDVAPGSRVLLELPAQHWRTVYWMLAVWACGGVVVGADTGADGARCDLLITDDPGHVDQFGAESTILVTLAALARNAAAATDAFDEARELATFPDVFQGLTRAGDSDVALELPARSFSYGDLLRGDGTSAGERVRIVDEDSAALLTTARVLAANGSVVLIRNPDQTQLAHRLSIEGVTASR